MRLLKRIYCRTFQKVMRAAIPFMPYRTPELFSDEEEVAKAFVRKNVDKVLIVTDRTVHGKRLTEPLEAAFICHGIGFEVYNGVSPNPTTDNVEDALRLYVNSGCNGIAAIGGGSAIDCAKAVGARAVRPKKTCDKMKGLLKIRKKLPALAAVPTTAGTGSETTLAAVITDADKHYKYPINDFSLIPRFALLDPELTVGLPRSVTATTGMDALTHAIEAYIGKSTTRATKKAAVEAVRLILKYLENAYADGNDMTARKAMLEAAFYAGKAFTVSYVGYVHAVAHSLGGFYGVPHGLANAVLLPIVLVNYGRSAHKKLAALWRSATGETGSDKECALRFIDKIINMNDNMNIPRTLDCIRAIDIPMLAARAATEGNPLYPVPVLKDANELEDIYYTAGGLK